MEDIRIINIDRFFWTTSANRFEPTWREILAELLHSDTSVQLLLELRENGLLVKTRIIRRFCAIALIRGAGESKDTVCIPSEQENAGRET